MEFGAEKKFKDNVHGYISIPEEYVKSFIDTNLFQRLRNIEQTGMRILFPSARHDRFIHSLGVYHLGRKAFQCFKGNVKLSYAETYYRVVNDEKENEEFWDECQILFEIACLMHDCGHSPFSHTLEYLYDLEPEGEITLREQLKNQFSSQEFRDDPEGHGGPHEVMSALLVCTEYRKEVDEILKNHGIHHLRLEDALEFIARMIIGFQYEDKNNKNQIRNCLISLLNSSSIDVDSLDYIIRDTRMSGVANMDIDVDRLLSSLTLVEMTEADDVHFNDDELTTIINDGILKNNNKNQAMFSGNFSGGMDAEKNTLAEGVQGTVSIEANTKIEEICEIHSSEYITKKIRLGGISSDELVKTNSVGKVEIRGVTSGKLGLVGEQISFAKDTNTRVDKVSADTIQFSSANVNGSLTGTFSGSFLGTLRSKGKFRGLETRCELGFHKSSLSIVQNVILARNYEYQWIYSHHKVVYYANYLEIELFRQCIRFLLRKEQEKDGTTGKMLHATDEMHKILSWKTMATGIDGCGPYEVCGIKFWRPTDSDILSVFKKVEIEAQKKQAEIENQGKQVEIEDQELDEVYKCIKEYTTRNYRKSLWKSYAEMHNFLRKFTQEDVSILFEILLASSSKPDVKADSKEAEVATEESKFGYRLNRQYGYPNKEWQDKFKKLGLGDVVWVNGDSKLKKLDPDQTFIHFKDVDMTYGSVSSMNSIHSIGKRKLFYIYYRPVAGKEVEKEELLKLFAQEIANYREKGGII